MPTFRFFKWIYEFSFNLQTLARENGSGQLMEQVVKYINTE